MGDEKHENKKSRVTGKEGGPLDHDGRTTWLIESPEMSMETR